MPKGRYVFKKEGCTRLVTEKVAAQYFHYTEEIIPFWKTYTLKQVKQSYLEIINFLFNHVYNAPIGQKLDKNGKVSLKK